jgi:WD40 repeat protein
LLRAIVDDPPAPLPPNVPRDLATISAKCLAKLPAARYATAAAFAADLRAWLDGRPIAARPLNTIARAWAYARRRPAIAALSSALVFALGFAAISLVRENRAAIAALTISRDAEKAARSAQADALLGEARAIRRANDVTRRDAAIDIVERSAKLRPSAAARDELLSLLALSALTESGVIRPSIHDRLWTPPRPDGDLTRYGAIADNAVSIRELRTAREIARVPSAPRSNYGAGPISPDGRWLIVRAEQATEVWDIAATKLLLSLPVLRGWTTFSNDGRFVALAPERGLSGTSLLCDLAANPPAARALETLPAQWHAFALSPDGKLLAITPNTSTSGLAIVDAATLAEVRRFETGSVGTLAAVQWNRAGDALFTGDNRGIVARWRPGMETPEWTLHAHEGAIHSLALTHGERTLATIGSDSLVKLWDLATLAPRGSLPWTGLSLAASRDGRTLLGQRSDPRSCPIFDCATPEICAMSALPPVALGNASQPGHPGVFAWPDSKHFIFTTGRDTHFVRDDATIESTLRLGLVDGYAIDAQTGGGIRVGGGAIMVHARGSTEEREIEGFKSSGPVVFHPSTRRLLVGNTLGAMGWTLGAEIQASDFGVPPHAGVWTAAWSPDGTRLAWAGPVKEGKNPLFFSAGIVDVEHRRELPPLAIGKRPYVKSLAFTADGSILVVGLLKEIMAFDVATGALRWRIPHERPPVHGPCLATAPGVLAATLGQQSVSLLDPATGAVRCTLTHPVERITHAIALSPDGKTLAVLAGALAQMWKLEVIEAELRRRGM